VIKDTIGSGSGLCNADPTDILNAVSFLSYLKMTIKTKNKQTPWPLVRKRTIPTERPPQNLVPTFVDRGVSRRQRGGSPTVVNLSFLDRKMTIIL
jgi:hypothetical protein